MEAAEEAKAEMATEAAETAEAEEAAEATKAGRRRRQRRRRRNRRQRRQRRQEMSPVFADQQRPRIRVQMRGDWWGGCGVSANEYSCAHHVTGSPNKLWRSVSTFII
jgi:hypothetical protein